MIGFIFCLLSFSSSFLAEANSDVIILTDSNFDSEMQKGKWLLEFYAPWCGHCKKLAPTYEEVATQMKDQVNVGKVDCTVETGVCGRFNIKGYPTLKFNAEGTYFDYSGNRSAESLVAFSLGDYKKSVESEIKGKVVEEAAISDVIILTDETFNQQTAVGDWLLEFYAPWCGHCKKLVPTYEQVATQLKGKVSVGKVDCTQEKKIASQFKIRGYPTLKFLTNGQLYDYNGDRSAADLYKFVSEGYKLGEPEPLPSPSSGDGGFMQELIEAMAPYENILWILLGVVFFLGVVLGGILFVTKSPVKSD